MLIACVLFVDIDHSLVIFGRRHTQKSIKTPVCRGGGSLHYEIFSTQWGVFFGGVTALRKSRKFEVIFPPSFPEGSRFLKKHRKMTVFGVILPSFPLRDPKIVKIALVCVSYGEKVIHKHFWAFFSFYLIRPSPFFAILAHTPFGGVLRGEIMGEMLGKSRHTSHTIGRFCVRFHTGNPPLLCGCLDI